MKKNLLAVLIAVFLMSSMVGLANATLLTSEINLDNYYRVYISTTEEGTYFGSGGNWQHTFTNHTTLTKGVDYYLHVYGIDWGGPSAFFGEFTLSGSDHVFENNTTSLLTNTIDWKGNNTSWGTPYIPLSDFGANGDSTTIWAISNYNTSIAAIPSEARWIWAGDSYTNNVAYFSTKISAVPEPATMLLFSTGLAGLAVLRRKRKGSRV